MSELEVLTWPLYGEASKSLADMVADDGYAGAVEAERRKAKLLVVHDEVDLEPGRLQLRLGGGLAGHNGLRSIAQTLGTKEFLRFRIGVGRPGRGDRRSVADFVLSDFESEVDLGEMVARAADAVELLAAEGLQATQARFNER